MDVLIVFVAGLATFLAVFHVGRRMLSRTGAVAVVAAWAAVGLALCAASLLVVVSPWMPAVLAAAAAVAAGSVFGPELGGLTPQLQRCRLPLYLLSVSGVAVLVFVAIPVTTFLTSPGELDIHLRRLLEVNARDVMVTVYAGAAVYLLAGRAAYRTVLSLVATGGFLLSWIYAFVLPFGYPLMSGLAFEQLPIARHVLLWRSVADLAVVVVVAGCLCWLLRRRSPRALLAALVLANVSVVIATGVSLTRERSDEAGEAAGADAPAPIVLSSVRPNTLVVFLDRFMGSYVESILAADPALASRLNGFVWYPRAVSGGENSIAGVHPMLGGYDYLPSEMNARGRPLRDLSVEAFSILPRNFADRGYRVSMVGPRGMGFTMLGDCTMLDVNGARCSHIPASISHRKAVEMKFPLNALAESNYADLLVLLASMRIAPYALKEIILAKGPWQPFLDHSAGTTFREWAQLEALGELTTVDEGASGFNFVSNILPHEPYFMGGDCVPLTTRPVIGKQELARTGHRSQFSYQHALAARCALESIGRYMERLEMLDVYDNTRIVIVSDHGIVGDVQDGSTRAVAGGTTENAYVSLRPLILVKEIGASGQLRVSEQFMPNAEVPRLVCEDIGGCTNPYLGGRPIAALGRDDPFPVARVPWQFSAQQPDAFVLKERLLLRGRDPFDRNGWTVQDDR
ncbi:hypothetical protein [Xanthomonas sp. XNM01]|uniref:hypothetical protein n=1 Tax=Xanthomonas sp. XNM01 TaxID=2769289 RepID=UPI00177CE070|nr:hypothetical protein [Xanthomonas sp. XNM01]MBD9369454.1 hypothetical protein [Xanthomonas sp. XNM01]